MNRGQTSKPQYDDRRARRRTVDCEEPVTNVLTGEAMGRIGNVSSTGMLLLCPEEPRSHALYQCMLPLAANGSNRHIEVGIQEQWHQPSESSEHYWAGFRIIAIRDEDHARLRAWLDMQD